jgi:beta-phosphoglucomutase-like phosphatase (HAD superfamily)
VGCPEPAGCHDRAVSRACLVLDFDGTILDTQESLYRSWTELWSEHGQRLALADWQHNIGTDDVFDPLVELETRLGRSVDPSAQARRRARRGEIQAAHAPRPGVLRWLAEARGADVPVGIASPSPLEQLSLLDARTRAQGRGRGRGRGRQPSGPRRSAST